MSSLGIAPAEERMYAAQKTITIENGDVILVDKDICVSPRAIIHFVNKDPNDYVLMFFPRGQDPGQTNAIHPDVDLFLPAFASSTMVAGLNLKQGECKYLVVPAPAILLGEKTILKMIEDKLTLSGHTLVLDAKIFRTEDYNAKKDPIDEVSHPVALDAKTGGGGGGGTIHIH